MFLPAVMVYDSGIVPGLIAAVADSQLSASGYKNNDLFYHYTNCRLGNELNAGAWVAYSMTQGQWLKVRTVEQV